MAAGVFGRRTASLPATARASCLGARRRDMADVLDGPTMINYLTRDPVSAQQPVQILIVDDHRDNLLALEAVLSPLGHRILQAQSVCTALKILLQKSTLNRDIFPFDPSELAQLLLESFQEGHSTSSRARIQVTDAKHFSRLLRRSGSSCQQDSCQ